MRDYMITLLFLIIIIIIIIIFIITIKSYHWLIDYFFVIHRLTNNTHSQRNNLRLKCLKRYTPSNNTKIYTSLTTDLKNTSESSIYCWETEANGGHIEVTT